MHFETSFCFAKHRNEPPQGKEARLCENSTNARNRLHQRAKTLYVGGSTRRDRTFNDLAKKKSRLLRIPMHKLVFRFADFPRNPGQARIGKCRILSHAIKISRTPLLDRTKLHVQPEQNVVNDRTSPN